MALGMRLDDYWTEVSPSGVSVAKATHPAETNMQHILKSFMVRSDSASNTVTFKTGDRMLGEYSIGATSETTPCVLAGDKGKDISAQLALTGTISITGQSIKKG